MIWTLHRVHMAATTAAAAAAAAAVGSSITTIRTAMSAYCQSKATARLFNMNLLNNELS
jgi:hypothetical protein